MKKQIDTFIAKQVKINKNMPANECTFIKEFNRNIDKLLAPNKESDK